MALRVFYPLLVSDSLIYPSLISLLPKEIPHIDSFSGQRQIMVNKQTIVTGQCICDVITSARRS